MKETPFIEQSAALFATTVEDILSNKRPQYIADARAAAMWAIRERLKWDDHKIAACFRRERSAVWYAIQKIKDLREANPEIKNLTDKLIA